MSYNVNLVPNIAPAGTVMQYASPIGVTDPSGWVICDGLSRSNDSGFYTNLLTSQLANVANANTTILNAPLNPTGFLPQASGSRNAISANGQVIAIRVYQGSLYISRNGGISWSVYSSGNYSGGIWGIAVSGSGSNMAWTNGGTAIVISTDYGFTTKTVSIGFSESGAVPNVVMSGDGTKIIAHFNSSLYLSTNSGNNFTLVSNTGFATGYQSIACSYDGNVFVAAVFTGSNIVISTNTGASWSTVAVGGSNYMNAIGISLNGQFMVTGARTGTGSNLYVSSSTGTYWTNVSSSTYGNIPAASKLWTAASVSSTGQYMIIGNGTDTIMYVSSNYGNWWTFPTVPPASMSFPDMYCQISMSQSSTAIYSFSFLAPIYISTNYGYNWSELSKPSTLLSFMPITTTGFGNNSGNGNGYSNGGVISHTGQIMATYGNITYPGVFLSTNSGNSFSRTWGGSLGTQYGITAMAMTPDGNTMVAAYNGSVHISTNYGNFWRVTTAPSYTYHGITISGNGKVIGACQRNNTGNVALSTDGGNTFIYYQGVNGLATGNSGSQVVATNTTGSVILMGNGGGSGAANGLYLSVNSGATWVKQSVSGGTQHFGGIAVSNDGLKLLGADGQSGNLSVSTNSGTTWINVSPAGNVSYYGAAMSGDGTIMMATANNTIWMSTNTGKNWLNLANYTIVPAVNAIYLSNDGTKLFASANNGALYVSNQAFSSSTYFSSFTPMNIANTTTIDGTTLKYIMKY
jgi:hypothetical protein